MKKSLKADAEVADVNFLSTSPTMKERRGLVCF